jgi:hypothetical protein
MNRRLALGTGLTALLVASVASAQEVTIGYQGLPYRASGESNTGIQVSESALLHVGIGAEAGYDTNVFYDNVNPKASGIIRVLPYADLSNATRTGAVSRELVFDLRAGLQYRRYTSNDMAVQNYSNAWMPNAGLSLSAGSGQIGFGLADTFARLEDPPYGPQAPGFAITRYNNQASVEGRWSPGGGRLSTMLRYTNMVDIFQGTYEYANADTNLLMLDAAWKWLPKTAIFLNAQQGYIFYLNDALAQANNKVSSYPLYVTAGLRGLLTEKTAAVLSIGYVNGFYGGTGGSTAGFRGSTYAEAAVTVRPTLLSRIVLGYRHDFENAVISSFYYNDTIYGSYVQQIAGRLALDLSGRFAHRTYGGAFVDAMQVGRVDEFFQAGASLDYFMRNWTYLGVGYSLIADQSNISTLSYVKQQMFVRLGITY